MHDIRAIRNDPAAFDAALARRGFRVEPGLSRADSIVSMDRGTRERKQRMEALQAERNERSSRIGRLRSQGDTLGAQSEQDRVHEIKEEMLRTEGVLERFEHDLNRLLLEFPNLPAFDVPPGFDESANVVAHTRGTKPAFDFPPQEHDTLAARLGYDPEAAAAIAGARFAVLKGPLARLHRVLGQFMLDLQTSKPTDKDLHGYTEVAPPLLVRSDAMLGTGQLPKFSEDSFKIENEDRWLIPTAEVSLTNLVRERILDSAELPLRFVALTPCFRQEAGSAGRDTRGLIRQHQFDKVELVSITHPDASDAEHERMTACAEAILDALELPYRRMLLCAGDMGFSARKTYDLEVWLPGQGRYREISSCSNCGDFQARRMDARFKTPGQKGTAFVHTLNGSGLAVGRTLVAVIENYQTADGSVVIPPVLRDYMGGLERLAPAG